MSERSIAIRLPGPPPHYDAEDQANLRRDIERAVRDLNASLNEILIAAGGGDHGSLAGLLDDDHTQYHTDARALTWLGTRSTSDLSEGTNLYYTDVRADARIALANLADLADVTITAIAAGELPKWSGSAWINQTLAEAGISALGHTHVEADITDLGNYAVVGHTHVEADITDLQAYLLGITGEPLSDLSDVTITAIAAGELLKWNGSAWVNNTLLEAGIAGLTAANTFSGTNTFSGNLTLGSFTFPAPDTTTHEMQTQWDGSRNRFIFVPRPSGSADFSKELYYNFSAGFWVIENVKLATAVGFFTTTPATKKTVTGSRAGNAALASLLTQLANYGLITNSTTA